MGVKRFEDLIAWQKAVELAVWIYELTECKQTRYRRLVDQMTAAAVSVPSNVAEGFERDMMKDFCRFLAMAKGSGGELITQLHIAGRIGCIERQSVEKAINRAREVNRLVGSLRTAIRKRLVSSRH